MQVQVELAVDHEASSKQKFETNALKKKMGKMVCESKNGIRLEMGKTRPTPINRVRDLHNDLE